MKGQKSFGAKLQPSEGVVESGLEGRKPSEGVVERDKEGPKPSEGVVERGLEGRKPSESINERDLSFRRALGARRMERRFFLRGVYPPLPPRPRPQRHRPPGPTFSNSSERS